MDKINNSSYELLDQAQIDMLLESGQPESIELFSEILVLFEEESRLKLAELDHAKSRSDTESFGSASHALAGSSANIGGKTVWLRAKDMENLCKSGQGDDAFEQLDALKSQFEATLVQLRAYLDSVAN